MGCLTVRAEGLFAMRILCQLDNSCTIRYGHETATDFHSSLMCHSSHVVVESASSKGSEALRIWLG